jgi:hypothetical protein
MAEAGVSKLLGEFSADSLRSGALDVAQYVIWGVLILGVAIFAYLKWQDKKVFIYNVRIFRQRNNGLVKEFNTMGGYMKKNNLTTFIIKMGKFKKKEADKLPLSELMDEDNRIYYWQISPDAPLIQIKRDFIIDQVLVANDKFKEPSEDEFKKLVGTYLKQIKEAEEYKSLNKEEQESLANSLALEEIDQKRNIKIDITKPTYSPVPSDLKQQAMAEINNYKNMLGVDVNKQMAYFVTGAIILSILGIILFYIAMNKGDVPILTEIAPLLLLKLKKGK